MTQELHANSLGDWHASLEHGIWCVAPCKQSFPRRTGYLTTPLNFLDDAQCQTAVICVATIGRHLCVEFIAKRPNLLDIDSRVPWI
jgi:hypothetical protein